MKKWRVHDLEGIAWSLKFRQNSGWEIIQKFIGHVHGYCISLAIILTVCGELIRCGGLSGLLYLGPALTPDSHPSIHLLHSTHTSFCCCCCWPCVPYLSVGVTDGIIIIIIWEVRAKGYRGPMCVWEEVGVQEKEGGWTGKLECEGNMEEEMRGTMGGRKEGCWRIGLRKGVMDEEVWGGVVEGKRTKRKMGRRKRDREENGA